MKNRTKLVMAATVLAGSLTVGSAARAAEESSQAVRIEVGQEAPGFSLTSSAGETYSLSDVKGEKDLVLIFFRGSW